MDNDTAVAEGSEMEQTDIVKGEDIPMEDPVKPPTWFEPVAFTYRTVTLKRAKKEKIQYTPANCLELSPYYDLDNYPDRLIVAKENWSVDQEKGRPQFWLFPNREAFLDRVVSDSPDERRWFVSLETASAHSEFNVSAEEKKRAKAEEKVKLEKTKAQKQALPPHTKIRFDRDILDDRFGGGIQLYFDLEMPRHACSSKLLWSFLIETALHYAQCFLEGLYLGCDLSKRASSSSKPPEIYDSSTDKKWSAHAHVEAWAFKDMEQISLAMIRLEKYLERMCDVDNHVKTLFYVKNPKTEETTPKTDSNDSTSKKRKKKKEEIEGDDGEGEVKAPPQQEEKRGCIIDFSVYNEMRLFRLGLNKKAKPGSKHLTPWGPTLLTRKSIREQIEDTFVVVDHKKQHLLPKPLPRLHEVDSFRLKLASISSRDTLEKGTNMFKVFCELINTSSRLIAGLDYWIIRSANTDAFKDEWDSVGMGKYRRDSCSIGRWLVALTFVFIRVYCSVGTPDAFEFTGHRDQLKRLDYHATRLVRGDPEDASIGLTCCWGEIITTNLNYDPGLDYVSAEDKLRPEFSVNEENPSDFNVAVPMKDSQCSFVSMYLDLAINALRAYGCRRTTLTGDATEMVKRTLDFGICARMIELFKRLHLDPSDEQAITDLFLQGGNTPLEHFGKMYDGCLGPEASKGDSIVRTLSFNPDCFKSFPSNMRRRLTCTVPPLLPQSVQM